MENFLTVSNQHEHQNEFLVYNFAKIEDLGLIWFIAQHQQLINEPGQKHNQPANWFGLFFRPKRNRFDNQPRTPILELPSNNTTIQPPSHKQKNWSKRIF